MNIFKTVFIALVMMVSIPAMAERSLAYGSVATVSGDVGLFTDYVWRGVSLTDGGSAAQANLTIDINKFYISAFTSNVDLPDSRYELDLAAGFANTLGQWDYDVGAVTYLYPGDTSDISIDTWEVYGGGGYSILDTNIGLKVAYSDDYFSTGKSWYTVVPVTYTSHYFDVMGSIGYLNLNDADIVKHTTDYKVAFTGHVTPAFDVYVAWTNLSPATEDFKLDFNIGDDLWTGGLVYNF